IANLRDAAKRGKATDMLLEALEVEGQRRDVLRRELETLNRRADVAGQDGAALRQALRARVSDLQGFLGEHVAQTRQVLRNLLVARLWWEPFPEPERRGYRFAGRVSYDGLMPVEVSRAYVVTPAGFEPAISTLKGSRPGPG